MEVDELRAKLRQLWVLVEVQIRELKISPFLRSEIGEVLSLLDVIASSTEQPEWIIVEARQAIESVERLFLCASMAYRELLAQQNYYRLELQMADGFIRSLTTGAPIEHLPSSRKSKVGNLGLSPVEPEYKREILEEAGRLSFDPKLSWPDIAEKLLGERGAGKRLSAAVRDARIKVGSKKRGRPRKQK